MSSRHRASSGATPTRKRLGALVAVVLVAPGCLGSSGNANGIRYRPGIVAIPHALFDPSAADNLARRASYGAWVVLDKEQQNPASLDLAVWPTQSAANRALAEYRGGGPKTRPLVPAAAWPHHIRRVERIRNVTLAWYQLPTRADETAVRGALRFSGGSKRAHDYTTLWVVPGTLIDPDASAATGAARYSASLKAVDVPGRCGRLGRCAGAVAGPVTVAIWSSENAAKRYIQYIKDGTHSKRIRNATIDDTGSFGYAGVSGMDVAAIRNGLH